MSRLRMVRNFGNNRYCTMLLINIHTGVSNGVRGLIFGLSQTLCMRAAKTLVSLRICLVSPEPSLPDNVIIRGLYIIFLALTFAKSERDVRAATHAKR